MEDNVRGEAYAVGTKKRTNCWSGILEEALAKPSQFF